MIDPELRDIKAEVVRLPGAPSWMRHLHIAQTCGDGSVKEMWLTEKQAAFIVERFNDRTKIS